VNTTLESPLTSSGQPRPQGRQAGSPALRAARQAKERTYPELVRGNRCRLVVSAMEVGGRWSHEAAEFLRLLAQARSRSVPHIFRSAAVQASIARWSALRTHAARAPFAASFVLQDPTTHTSRDGNTPPSAHSLNTTQAPHPNIPPRFSTLRPPPLWMCSRPLSVTPDQNTDLIAQSKRCAERKKLGENG
jgi:hypothetical protein